MDPAPSPRSGPGQENTGSVVFRAFVGFFTYVGVGWFSLMVGRFGLMTMIALIIGAIALAVSGKWRGFALGVLIGAGLTLLLVGACFAMFAAK
jgi:hypothetical protein